jgi:hypothetical protein
MKVFIELDIQTFKHDQAHVTRADNYFADLVRAIAGIGKGCKIVRLNAVDEHMTGDEAVKGQIEDIIRETLPEKIVEENNNEVKA